MTAAKIFEVDALACKLGAHDWRFELENGAEIDRFFRERQHENPALYDGRVLLASRADMIASGNARILEIDAFETGFSRFLAWRDFGFPDKSVVNFFSMPAVRSTDGAYLVGEMGSGHSSAGALYFPAGTPDTSDIVADGDVDLFGSLTRELAEETGLDLREGACASTWTIVSDRQFIACVKCVEWPEPASAILRRVRAFLASEAAPELADVHMIAGREQLDDSRFPDFMVGFLRRAFQTRSGRG